MQKNVALWLNRALKRKQEEKAFAKSPLIIKKKTPAKGCFGRGPFEGRVPNWSK